MTPNGQPLTGSAGAFAEGGATVDVAKAERGFAERPMLAPRLEFRTAEAFDGLYGREGGHGGAGCGRRPGSSTTAHPTLRAGATVRRYVRNSGKAGRGRIPRLSIQDDRKLPPRYDRGSLRMGADA